MTSAEKAAFMVPTRLGVNRSARSSRSRMSTSSPRQDRWRVSDCGCVVASGLTESEKKKPSIHSSHSDTSAPLVAAEQLTDWALRGIRLHPCRSGGLYVLRLS